MPTAKLLISEKTYYKIEWYYKFLLENGLEHAGANLKQQIDNNKTSLKEINLETFTKLIIKSKTPLIFAESAVAHDQSDWTLVEESILGDITYHVEVNFYNDGGHYSSFKNHNQVIAANLAFIPGALFNAHGGKETSDMQEVINNKKINQAKLNNLYERRLLPQLLQINSQAKEQNKKAAITLPGIGTGCFAGVYRDNIGSCQ